MERVPKSREFGYILVCFQGEKVGELKAGKRVNPSFNSEFHKKFF